MTNLKFKTKTHQVKTYNSPFVRMPTKNLLLDLQKFLSNGTRDATFRQESKVSFICSFFDTIDLHLFYIMRRNLNRLMRNQKGLNYLLTQTNVLRTRLEAI